MVYSGGITTSLTTDGTVSTNSLVLMVLIIEDLPHCSRIKSIQRIKLTITK